MRTQDMILSKCIYLKTMEVTQQFSPHSQSFIWNKILHYVQIFWYSLKLKIPRWFLLDEVTKVIVADLRIIGKYGVLQIYAMFKNLQAN